MGIESNYTYMKWPWISKSSFSLYKWCRWSFLDSVINGNRSKPNKIMKVGTGLHEWYYTFFDMIDYDKLFTLDYETDAGTHFNQVAEYFSELIINELPSNFNNIKFINNIRAFALFEADHWYSVNKNFKSMASIRKNFHATPSNREYTQYCDDFMIYGTIDRRIDISGYTLIHDYKTGNVPIGTVRNKNVNGWCTADGISSTKTQEGNFYCLLEIFNRGYTASKQDHVNTKGEHVKRWTFFLDGKKKEDFRKWLGFSYLYTGGMENGMPVYYFVKKKCSIVSLRNILDKLEEIRANEDWPRDYDEFKCERCGKYETDCRGKIPIELYGNRIQREEKYEVSRELCGGENPS